MKQVIDKYCAMVTMLDTGHTLKLDQEHLETVIPAEGKTNISILFHPDFDNSIQMCLTRADGDGCKRRLPRLSSATKQIGCR